MQGRSVRLQIESDSISEDQDAANLKQKGRRKHKNKIMSFKELWSNHVDSELCDFSHQIKQNMKKRLYGERLRCDLINSLIVVDDETNGKRLPVDLDHLFRSHAIEKFGPEIAEDLYLGERQHDLSDMAEEAVSSFMDYWKRDPLDEDAFFGNVPHDILSRIKNFAKHIRHMLSWSLISEPGRFTCNLAKFIDEFVTMDSFFDKIQLHTSEVACTAFKRNFAEKARNHRLSCLDRTRVIVCNQEEQLSASLLLETTFQGTADFIHANYVSGGPLFNRFICTQAPLRSTVNTFWEMVYQQRCEYIFMLCSACDTEDKNLTKQPGRVCPIYWPRDKGSSKVCGSLLIKNLNVTFHTDPLFTVTLLEISYMDSDEEPLYLQHWQWNWNSYKDTSWPLRLLRRSRTSNSPTVVHCLDGCSKTGTLVAIETVLCQIARGSVGVENAVLSSCLFVRLQRKHAVANYKQYLYIYRCVLDWILPYVTSRYDLLTLGGLFPGVGFIAAYNDLIDGSD
ncbi:hypothetical protein QR680_001690 [Steinernema hermaphroditum]|uniref:Tyrosine-protein phosphatase domain-containing protein n=1 Tax=Steinernema hermaphroditum TaxID=289476 RepID=A0AA39LGM2_9BILA|nr:hypothetical protein QR680_001690 [Steinernema hermaphroditum]